MATNRAQLLKPQNQFLSGPITETMTNPDVSKVDEFQFLNPNWTQPQQFTNQSRVYRQVLYP
jgi:hypothetical protein